MDRKEISALIHAGQLPRAMTEAKIGMAQSTDQDNMAELLGYTTLYVRASRMVGDYVTSLTLGDQIVQAHGAEIPESGMLLVEMANTMRLQRNYTSAANALARAIPLLEGSDYAKPRSQAQWGLGVLYRLEGNFFDAQTQFTEALGICNDLGYSLGSAHCYREIGVTFRQLNQYKGARRALNRALEIYHQENNLIGIAHSTRELGTVERLEQNLPAAFILLRQALDGFIAIDAKLGIANTYTELAVAFQLSHDMQSADNYYTAALLLYEELGNEEGPQILRHMQEEMINKELL